MRKIVAHLKTGDKVFPGNITEKQVALLKEGDVVKYVVRAFHNEWYDHIGVAYLTQAAGMNGYQKLTVFVGTWMVDPCDIIDVIKKEDVLQYGNPEEFFIEDFDENFIYGRIEKHVQTKRF